eukprot:CCRYP_007122-RA/>CCRYP_007122-RA protein AED:0.19 eAED:0.19 QI:71/1/1/1/1/0.5/2/46/3063
MLRQSLVATAEAVHLSETAMKLQCWFRSVVHRRRYMKVRESIMILQRRARVISALRHSSSAKIQAVLRSASQRKKSATMRHGFILLQARCRGANARRHFEEVAYATVKLQSLARMTAIKRAYCRTISGVTLFQRRVRKFTERKSIVPFEAAVKIQSCLRSLVHQRRYVKTRMSLSLFQGRVRGIVVRLHLCRQQTCAILIQSTVRAFIQRHKYIRILSGFAAFQIRVRVMQENLIHRRRTAALIIQTFLRSACKRRQYLRLIFAISAFQARARGRQSRLLLWSKVAANIAWNDHVIAPQQIGQLLRRDSETAFNNDLNVNIAVTRLQSIFRAFRSKITTAQKLLLSWRMDCYYPSHIQNQISLIRAGILVLKVAIRGIDVSSHVTSSLENDSYTDIHWRQAMKVDLSGAFGRKAGTLVSPVTLVIKFRRRRTVSFCRSHEFFVRATLQYALQREVMTLERKSMKLILTFIQASLAKARNRRYQHIVDRFGETNMSTLQLSALKIQRFWRSCAYLFSIPACRSTASSARSRAERFERLCRSCVLVQATIRGYLLRSHIRCLSGKARLVQRAWACYRSRSRLEVIHWPLLAFQRRWKESREQESVTSTSSHSSGRADSILPSPSYTFHGEPKSSLFQDMHHAVIILQAHVRAFVVQKKYARIRSRVLQQKHNSAVIIQTLTRVAFKRRRFEKLRNGIIRLQAHVRGADARVSYYIIYAATIKIQSSIRAALLQNSRAQSSNDKDLNAVVQLQARYRCYYKHSQFVKLMKGLIFLQARIRGAKVRLICQSLHRSIILIQSMIRGALSREKVKRILSGVLLLQAKFRGRVQKIAYATILASVIRIQGFVRLITRRSSYSAMIAGITRLQGRARGISQRARLVVPLECTVISRSDSISVEPITPSVLKIQALVRKKIHNKRYMRLRRYLIMCQACVRRTLSRRLISLWRSSAAKIQASVRRYNALNTFKKRKSSAIVIQARARAAACRRQYSVSIDELHCIAASARTIQRTWYRYKTIHIHCRPLSPEYFMHHKTMLETSIVIIQRKYLWSRELMRKEQAARKLQSFIRKSVTRKKITLAHQELLKMGCAAKKLQAWTRAWIMRRNIKLVKERALKIQRCYQRYLNAVGIRVSNNARAAYTEELRVHYENSAATILQAQLRRWRCRRELCLIRSVVKIQRLHRRKHKSALARLDIMQREERNWEREESAAKKIQSVVRSWWRQKDLESEKELVSAIDFVGKRKPPISNFILPDSKQILSTEPATAQAIVLSSPVRKLQEEHYRKVSARAIQKVARGWLCRSHLSLLNLSALKIQQWYQYRTVCSARNTNVTSFEKLQSRLGILVKRRTNETEATYNSAITIQKALRKWKHRRSYASGVMEHVKRSESSSSIVIQAVTRGHLTRNKYRRWCHCARVVQKRWKTRQYRVYSKNYKDYCRRVTLIQMKFRQKTCGDATSLDAEESMSLSSSKESFEQPEQQLLQYLPDSNGFLLHAVQSMWRGALVRKRLQRKDPFILHSKSSLLSSLIRIQAIVRMSLIKTKYFRLRKSASVIQRLWKRSPKAIATSARDYEQYYKRIALLQRFRRFQACGDEVIEFEKESISLSSYEEASEQQGKNDLLVRSIQSIWRGFLVRKHSKKTNDAALTIQQVWAKYRSFSETSYPVDCDLAKICEKMMKLQAVYHGRVSSTRPCLQASNNDVESIDLKCSISVFQAIWRGRRIMKQLNMWTAAATVVQKQWKKNCKSRGILREQQFAAMCAEVHKMREVSQQRKYPPQRDGAKKPDSLRAVCLIQAKLRGALARKQLITSNHAAVMIQIFWLQCSKFERGSHMNGFKRQRHLFPIYVAQTHRVQTFFKEALAKSNLATIETAAITVQSYYRTHKAKSTYSSIVRSAKRLQEFIRISFSKHAFRLMIRQQRSAIMLQSLFRAVKVRLDVSKRVTAAKTIQCKFRASRIRHQFEERIQFVILLQNFARMALARKAFHARLRSCVLIQNISRGFLTCLRLRYLSSKTAIIQNGWLCYRARCKPLNQKKFYTPFCSALVTIQKNIKRRFDRRNEAAKKIQVLYFSWRMQISLVKVLNSVVQVQRIARGHLSRHNTSSLSRQESSELKRQDSGLNDSNNDKHDSALILQRFFRSYFGGPIDVEPVALSRVESDIDGISSDSDEPDIPEQVSADITAVDGAIESDTSDSRTSDETKSQVSRPGTSGEALHDSALILQRLWRSYLYRSKDMKPVAPSKIDSKMKSPMSDENDYSGISHHYSTKCKMNHGRLEVEMTLNEPNPTATHNSKIDNASSAERQTRAVILLQGIARKFLCQRKARRFHTASARIQRAWSDYKFKNIVAYSYHGRLKHFGDATIVIQSKWRHHAKAKVSLKQVPAAIKLQSIFRSWLCQNTLISSQRSAVRIQQCYLSHVERQSIIRFAAATLLQSKVRTWRCQHELLSFSRSALKIQRCCRAFLRTARKEKMHKKLAYENELRERQGTNAAVLLQSAMRTWMCQRVLAKSISAVVLIQRKTRRVHEACARKEKAVIKAQSLARLYLAKALLRKERAAVKVQSHVRTWLSRRHLSCMKHAFIPIVTQSNLDFTAEIIPNKNSAAAKIQSFYRQYLTTRNDTQNGIAMEDAAIKLQSLYRRYYVQSVLPRGQSAIKIQSYARMYFAAARLSIMRTACTQIQASFRRHQDQEMLRKKILAAKRLQCLFRMNVAKSSRLHLEFKATESKKAVAAQTSSAVALQRVAGGYLVRRRLNTAHKAATIIQRTWRNCVIRLQKKLLQVFHLRSSPSDQHSVAHTSILKRSSSALLPKDKQKLNRIRDITPHLPREHGVFIELILNSVAVNIQSFTRRHHAMKRFKVQLAALKCIQQCWRRRQRRTRVTSATVTMEGQLDSETNTYVENNESKNDTLAVKETYADFRSTEGNSGHLSPNGTTTEHAEDHSSASSKPSSITIDNSLDSSVILIQSLFRGSNVRKERSICNSSAAILQGFLRRRCKSKSKRRGSNVENCSASIGSSGSRSSLRLSTEDENHALLDEIYQKAEANAVADSRSVCVSQYAWRLLLATEQELMLDGSLV